jgi:hypothetical protein
VQPRHPVCRWGPVQSDSDRVRIRIRFGPAATLSLADQIAIPPQFIPFQIFLDRRRGTQIAPMPLPPKNCRNTSPGLLGHFPNAGHSAGFFIRLGLRHNRANLTELPAAGKFPEPEPLTVSAPNVRMFIAIQCYKNFSAGASKETLLPEPREAPGVALEDSLDPLGGCSERVAIDPRWPLGSLCSRA